MAKKKLACAKCGGVKKMQQGGGTVNMLSALKESEKEGATFSKNNALGRAKNISAEKYLKKYLKYAHKPKSYSYVIDPTVSVNNKDSKEMQVTKPKRKTNKSVVMTVPKAKKGGSVSGGTRSAKALMENMGTSGQYGKMQMGGEKKFTKATKKSIKAAVKDSRIAEKAQKAFNKQMNTPAQKSGTYKRLGKKVKRLTSKLK